MYIQKKKETFTTFVFICKFARDRLSSKYLDLDPPSSCNEHESGTQNFRGASFTKDNQVDFLVPLPPLSHPIRLLLAENAISETSGTNFQQIAPARFSRRFNTHEYRVYIPEFSRGRRP